MSRLVDGITTSPAPAIDPRLGTGIQFVTTTPFPPEICTAMSFVLKALADQLQTEERSLGNQTVCCIFSDSDSFSIQLDPDQIAVCMRIAFYPLEKITPYIGTDRLYTILAEELCHLVWDISDEVEVNFKVLAVLRNLNPGLQMSDLYSEDTVRSCSRWLQDHPAYQP